MANASITEPQPNLRVTSGADFDTPSLREDAQRLLRLELNPYQIKLNAILLERLTAKLFRWLARQQKSVAMQLMDVPRKSRKKWLADRFGGDRRQPEQQAARYLTDFLNNESRKLLSQLREQKNDNRAFRKSLSTARTELERREIILGYAKSLGANETQLAEDRRAFERWFDEEAVTDRFAKLSGETELELSFVFERLGVMVDYLVRKSISQQQHESPRAVCQRLAGLWERLRIQPKILAGLRHDGDPRLAAAALKCLRLAIQSIPSELMLDIVEPPILDLVHRLAVEGHCETWQQCDSLSILAKLSFEYALPVLQDRLQRDCGVADDIFVRRHIVQLLEKNRAQLPEDSNFEFLVSDPSPFVRQQAAQLLFLMESSESRAAWNRLVSEDPEPSVRAAAALCLVKSEFDGLRSHEALPVVVEAMRSESSEFVTRTLLHVSKVLLNQLLNHSPELDDSTRQHFVDRYSTEVLPAIRELECNCPAVLVRRWASQTAEMILLLCDPLTHSLYQKLKPQLVQIKVGRSRRYPASWFKDLSDQQLGRLFAVFSQDDFGYDLQRGWFGVKVTRGPQFVFRLWRFLFEFRNTATDKRQGISHSIGRISTATTRAPSQILGELSETKVPGEPLTIASDGTWRPFLPLVDDFVSVLNMSWFWPASVNFYTSQGMTTVRGPNSLLKRLRSVWQLNVHFKKWADLRNWDDSSFPANSYIDEMRSLGFRIEFSRFDDASSSADESVEHFFRAAAIGLPIAGVLSQVTFSNYLYRFVDYFSAAFENSLEELVVFAIVVLTLFCLKHLWSNYAFRRARRKIPLSIGGWGTRGKSGTERLKAALFGVLGHGVVSKTTGCEAMFIQGYAFGDPIEIPLFRPYDKATIWEQSNLIRLAARLEPSVFLWECMALNPSYVDLLQRQWMQDDLTTITNTYPDHEDVQGPAGYNVAQTISCFVPIKSVCISTEQTMRPYVTDECRKLGTLFQGVGWLESGLIPPDILERFPYQEHPDNIALVATLADQLGVGYEYSLKAMADFLVPDLGVLKTHRVATVRHRRIEFTNGCSANERFGCMGNWKRLGFDAQDPWNDPCTWISGVVNNRADRVPRSKVFARIIVSDIHADCFLLIGNNLEGLQGYIAEAWNEHAENLTLHENGEEWCSTYAQKAFKRHAWDMRQPIERTQVVQKLECMLNSVVVGDSKTDFDVTGDLRDQLTAMHQQYSFDEKLAVVMQRHLDNWLIALDEYQQMCHRIESTTAADAASTEDEFRNLMKRWYFRKIVVVEDYFASGEQVVHKLVEETPPGFTNRVMGLQNIKGTGLDFVYRFQAWDLCHEACDLVRSKQTTQIEKGLQALIAMPVLGQLCQELVAETILWCRSNKEAAPFADMVDQLEQKLESKIAQNAISADVPHAQSGGKISQQIHEWICSTAEQILDVNDSVVRRDRADAIYRDLGDLRISRQRAIIELRKLTKRQKGGWLKAKKSA